MLTAPTMSELRLLYLMHLDWNWIKQRPQFLAEALNDCPQMDVTVGYQVSWRRRRLTNNASRVRRIPLPTLPFRRRAVPHVITDVATKAALDVLRRAWAPHALLVTHPELWSAVPGSLRQLPLFYDCMDDVTGFVSHPADQERLRALEARIVGGAAAVFVSSSRLVDLMAQRGCSPILVRNGYAPVAALPPPMPLRRGRDEFRIGYFGTIGQWVDTELCLSVLKLHRELVIEMWGPVTRPIPQHDRLVLHRPIPHERVAYEAAKMDALILPFRVDPLVEAVDPVKLYEYLLFGRPIIAVGYAETERFSELIHLYHSRAEAIALIGQLTTPSGLQPPNQTKTAHFLRGADWSSRACVIATEIRRVMLDNGAANC